MRIHLVRDRRKHLAQQLMHEPSELLYTTESPALTASEIARRTITETMAANARAIRERLDNDDE